MTVSITTSSKPQVAPIAWQLCGALHPGEPPQYVDLNAARFRIGRRPGLNLTLPSMQVSMIHAEFVQLGGRIFLRDLNSTNGTYVNGARVGNRDIPLRDGDRIRVGTLELRLMRRWTSEPATQPDVPSGVQTDVLTEAQVDDPAAVETVIETVIMGDTALPFELRLPPGPQDRAPLDGPTETPL